MEILVTREEFSDELEHHGTKGMQWGKRLYQNKDGSLTALGKKRYNKQAEKLKAEEEKIKAAEKAAATRKRTQAKFDKLDAKAKELEERKKALKSGKKDDSDEPDKKKEKHPEESLEQKRERLLKSSDPKELYDGRDALTYNELNDRINRIDLENRLQSKIPAEPAEPAKKTGLDRMDKAKEIIDKSTALYKSVDSAVSTLANSYIGKALADALDIELPSSKEKRPSMSDILKNPDKYDNATIKAAQERESNLGKLEERQNTLDNRNKKQQEKAAKEAQNKQNDSNNNGENKTQNDTQNSNNQNKQNKQNKQEKQVEPEVADAPNKTKTETNNSSKKSGEDISDVVEWKDLDKKTSSEVNNSINNVSSTKIDNIDYKKYQKDMEKWREKYDSEDSTASQKEMLDALYEIEKEYGISWRKL